MSREAFHGSVETESISSNDYLQAQDANKDFIWIQYDLVIELLNRRIDQSLTKAYHGPSCCRQKSPSKHSFGERNNTFESKITLQTTHGVR